MAGERTLVLNSNYQVIGIVTWEKAITLIYEDVAETLYEWNDSVKKEVVYNREVSNSDRKFVYQVPAIVVLKNNNMLPKQRAVKFSKINVHYRDDFTCQYCGFKSEHNVSYKSKKMTIDHVVPVSKGGKTTFDNCVVACIECNSIKGDKPLHETTMKLMKKPIVPSVSTISMLLNMQMNKKKMHSSWVKYLGSVKF